MTTNGERREDEQRAALVDAALRLCSAHGIDPAITLLEQSGFERRLILRVLSSPSFHRKLRDYSNE